jgi:hypothetical protein
MAKTFFNKLFGLCLLLIVGSLFVGCDSAEALRAEAQANDALERTLEGATIKMVEHERWKRTTLITLADGRVIRVKSDKHEHIMFVLPENTKTEE